MPKPRVEDHIKSLQNKLLRSHEECKLLKDTNQGLANENAKLYRKLRKKNEELLDLQEQMKVLVAQPESTSKSRRNSNSKIEGTK